jgi:hypothetical protein
VAAAQPGILAQPVVLDVSKPLEKVVLYALEEAQRHVEEAGALEPFTVVLCAERLFVESHSGPDAQACLQAAARAVQTLAHLAHAYVFVYDGYINSATGRRDALIAERGIPGSEQANAFALPYHCGCAGGPEGKLNLAQSIYSLGPTAALWAVEPLSEEQTTSEQTARAQEDVHVDARHITDNQPVKQHGDDRQTVGNRPESPE